MFGLALESLKACECNREPHKDGCYRCVYAYRRSRDMALTSRRTAVEILESILDRVQELEEVEGLDKVKVNAVLESELEARFIEALAPHARRRRDAGGTARSRAGQARLCAQGRGADLVRGAPGRSRRIRRCRGAEPPGLPDPSPRGRPRRRPSRCSWTDSSTTAMRRIRIPRNAWPSCGQGFLVWSLTWHDLEVAFGKAAEAVDFLDAVTNGSASVVGTDGSGGVGVAADPGT